MRGIGGVGLIGEIGAGGAGWRDCKAEGAGFFDGGWAADGSRGVGPAYFAGVGDGKGAFPLGFVVGIVGGFGSFGSFGGFGSISRLGSSGSSGSFGSFGSLGMFHILHTPSLRNRSSIPPSITRRNPTKSKITRYHSSRHQSLKFSI